MANIKDIDYQKEAILGCKEEGQEGLLSITKRLLGSNRKDYPEVILKAITGAGKTVIMANYINAVIEEDKRQHVVFVWLSIGTGGLQIQSQEKITPLLSSKITEVICPKTEKDFQTKPFKDGNLLILNWEKINNTKKNKLTSNLMTGEKHNIKQAVKNTNEDIKFIVMVDEFHKNYQTDAYKLIMNLFHPMIILGMTATPTSIQLSNKEAWHNIHTAKVREEGMIKKGTLFNDGLSEITLSTSSKTGLNEEIIKLAINKRMELEKMFRDEDSDVIPLCLIQIPNADKDTFDEITSFLSKQKDNDIEIKENEEDGYTCWMSDKPKAEELIKNMDNNSIKYLIFKQAVATGWDCPRAHILIKFRPLKDRMDSFDLQTIGRVLRTPERKHYVKYDDLNYAYIYAPEKRFEFDKDVEKALGNPETRNQTVKYNEDLDLLESFLESEQLEESQLSDQRIKEIFMDILKSKHSRSTENADYNKIHIFNGKMETNDKLLEDEIYFKTKDNVITFNSVQLNRKFEAFLKSLVKPYMSYNNINSYLFEFFGTSNTSTTDEIIKSMEQCLIHEDSIKKSLLETGTKIHQETDRKKIGNCLFEFKRNPKYLVENKTTKYQKCIYKPCVDNGFSEPEVIFIQELEKNDSVKWWYKNLDKGKDALCVVYVEAEATIKGKQFKTLAPTFPDFIVFFEDKYGKQSLGIYEIKDVDKLDYTNDRKDSAIKTYISVMNKIVKDNKIALDYIYGGRVKIKNLKQVDEDDKLLGEVENIDDYNELK